MRYLLVVISAIMGVISQMMLKYSAQQKHEHWWREYINVWVIGGYTVMVLSLALSIMAIHMGVLAQEVSIIECINYLLVPIAAWMVFKETIARRHLIAIVIIMVGVVIFFL